MRRLSIVDLPGGHQPIENEDGTLAIVFNGEIYNFRELRAELEALGHYFRTRSDTEVIIHAYEEWGQDCVERLGGMFAFAILERTKVSTCSPRRIFLARDLSGIKPLYYWCAAGLFVFASEVRGLLASGLIARRLSKSALTSYLLFGSICEPETLVEGIDSLPPGHRMMIDVDSPQATPEPWWRFADAESPVPKKELGEAEAALRVRGLLEESVRAHLVADVPLGVFLSSGVDSTALAALARRERRQVETLTVVFPEQDFSEAEIARRTAARLGTQHREMMISGEAMAERLDECVRGFDQPSMDGVNTYFVSWAARQAGLKVALSGLGSDEIFGGYTTFQSAPSLQRFARMTRALPRGFRSATASVLESLARRVSQPDASRKFSSAWLDADSFPHSYFFTRALFTPEKVTFLLGGTDALMKDAPWQNWLERAAKRASDFDPKSAVSWLELRSYLVNTLLRDTDAMSMQNSLEVRVPFLDHALLEFVLGLPASVKWHHATPKILLIEALRDILPEEVVAQRKRTFTFPWERWLLGSLGNRVSASLADWAPSLQELMDSSAARGVWQDFRAGKTSWSRPWSLFVLNEWVKRNLETNSAGEPHSLRIAAIAPVV